MTPGQAQELLKRATPGPWELERIDGMLHIFLPTGNGAPEEQDMPLIAAAPELAELVANLRYEYAVQVEYADGETEYARSFLTATPSIADAWWTDKPNKGLAAKWQENALCNARIVRRLVGEPEVVE